MRRKHPQEIRARMIIDVTVTWMDDRTEMFPSVEAWDVFDTMLRLKFGDGSKKFITMANVRCVDVKTSGTSP